MNDLPDELVNLLLNNLTDNDLDIMIGVNQRFYHILSNVKFWLDKIGRKMPHLSLNKSLKELKFIDKQIVSPGTIYVVGDIYDDLSLHKEYKIPEPLGQYNNVVSVSCGGKHMAFITALGTIYTFGKNKYGQLGVLKDPNEVGPFKLEGFSDVIHVSCGKNHTVFLTGGGKVYAFGSDEYGQLGLADNPLGKCCVATEIPTAVKVVQISCGHVNTLFLDNEGQVYISGLLNGVKYGPYLIKIPVMDKVKQVSAGSFHIALLSQYGDIYVMGSNMHSQLGVTQRSSIDIPSMLLDYDDVVQISCGDEHTGLVTKDGKHYVFTHFSDLYKLDDVAVIASQVSCGGIYNAIVDVQGIPHFFPLGYIKFGPIRKVSCGLYLAAMIQ